LKIKGKVLDETGFALSGATVLLLKDNNRTNLATISDSSGGFVLNSENIKDDDVIEIRFMGFETKFYKAQEIDNLTINLVTSIDLLDEVLITTKIDNKFEAENAKKKSFFKQNKKTIMVGVPLILGTIGFYIYFKNK